MPNYNSTIRKLQLALKQQGFVVSISYTQFYNNDKNCFVTMTSVRHKNKVLFRSGNKVVVIKNLAQILNIIKDINKQTVFTSAEVVTHYNESFCGNRIISSYNLLISFQISSCF